MFWPCKPAKPKCLQGMWMRSAGKGEFLFLSQCWLTSQAYALWNATASTLMPTCASVFYKALGDVGLTDQPLAQTTIKSRLKSLCGEICPQCKSCLSANENLTLKKNPHGSNCDCFLLCSRVKGRATATWSSTKAVCWTSAWVAAQPFLLLKARQRLHCNCQAKPSAGGATVVLYDQTITAIF